MVMPTTAQAVPIVMPAMTRPTAAMTHAKHKFQRRSPMRSETQPQATMLSAPNAYGIMLTQPTCMLDTPSCLTICGRNNRSPRLAVTMPK